MCRAAIRLNISGVIANRGDSIQYVHTDSNHTDPLYRITPAKLLLLKCMIEKNIWKCF